MKEQIKKLAEQARVGYPEIEKFALLLRESLC